MTRRSAFVVVANRLPLDAETTEGGQVWRLSPGGLVTALSPVVRARHGTWVGWAGGSGPAPEPFELDGIHLHPVELSAADLENFYEGESNSTIWPLYHDAVEQPVYDRVWRDAYRTVNARFADAAAAVAARNATVWVHDYQLQLVPAMLRARTSRSADRLLPPHPVSADRALHADAASLGDPQRPPRRGSRGLPATSRRSELRPAHPPPPRPALPGHDDRRRRSPRHGGSVSDLDRPPRDVGARLVGGRARSCTSDPGRAREPEDDHPRRRQARLHKGDRAPAPGLQGAARGRDG